jgi:hypothetical protein
MQVLHLTNTIQGQQVQCLLFLALVTTFTGGYKVPQDTIFRHLRFGKGVKVSGTVLT